jgi:hypothetical protein
MTTKSIGRVKLKTDSGRTRIEPAKPRLPVGKRKNIEAQAKRQAEAWKKRSKTPCKLNSLISRSSSAT